MWCWSDECDEERRREKSAPALFYSYRKRARGPPGLHPYPMDESLSTVYISSTAKGYKFNPGRDWGSAPPSFLVTGRILFFKKCLPCRGSSPSSLLMRLRLCLSIAAADIEKWTCHCFPIKFNLICALQIPRKPYRSTRLLQLTSRSQYDGKMWLALSSVKYNNANFLNQIRYFSIK